NRPGSTAEHEEDAEFMSTPVWGIQADTVAKSADSAPRVRLVRIVMWITTVLAGLLQALAARFSISGDGNSYLEVASAYLRGDNANAINAYWSPLYSWLIAFVLWIFKPTGYWESIVLHLLDFCGLVVALLAFEFFFRAFLAVE